MSTPKAESSSAIEPRTQKLCPYHHRPIRAWDLANSKMREKCARCSSTDNTREVIHTKLSPCHESMILRQIGSMRVLYQMATPGGGTLGAQMFQAIPSPPLSRYSSPLLSVFQEPRQSPRSPARSLSGFFVSPRITTEKTERKMHLLCKQVAREDGSKEELTNCSSLSLSFSLSGVVIDRWMDADVDSAISAKQVMYRVRAPGSV